MEGNILSRQNNAKRSRYAKVTGPCLLISCYATCHCPSWTAVTRPHHIALDVHPHHHMPAHLSRSLPLPHPLPHPLPLPPFTPLFPFQNYITYPTYNHAHARMHPHQQQHATHPSTPTRPLDLPARPDSRALRAGRCVCVYFLASVAG